MALLVITVLVVTALTVTNVETSSKLPSNFQRCSVSDPKLDECLRSAVEDAFHKMKNGVGSLGVLPIDPLRVDQIKINQGQGSVVLNMDLTNITMHGLANTKITNYSAEIENGILRTESLTPTIQINFNHVVSGRILLLPMRGAGPGNLTLKDVTTYHYLKSIPKKKKDGRMYWNMQEYKVKFLPKAIAMHFDGLFGGDKRLADQLNTFMNQNSLLVFEEIGGSFEDAFGAVFKEITSRVFGKVPFDDIFITEKKQR